MVHLWLNIKCPNNSRGSPIPLRPLVVRALSHDNAAATFFAAAVPQEQRCFTAAPATQTRLTGQDCRTVSLNQFDRMDNSKVVATLCFVLARRRRKKRKTRTIWIDPFLSARKSNGKFYCDYERLRKNPKKFRTYFRMSIDTFDQLLERLHNSL